MPVSRRHGCERCKPLHYDPQVGRVPIVVCMEAGAERNPDPNKVQSQTTVVKVLQGEDGSYTAQPIKQKIQVGSTPYELQEIFGIDQSKQQGAAASAAASAADGGDGAEGDKSAAAALPRPHPQPRTLVRPPPSHSASPNCASLLRPSPELRASLPLYLATCLCREAPYPLRREAPYPLCREAPYPLRRGAHRAVSPPAARGNASSV